MRKRRRFKTSWCVFDLPKLQSELIELEKTAEAPDLWDNAEKAQRSMRRLSQLRTEIDNWLSIEQKIGDAIELASMDDKSLQDEMEQELDEIVAQRKRLEFTELFSDEYDSHDAILSIHAGAGGTDSQDWVQILHRMYMRWAETHDYGTEIIDQSAGEEAGIKRVTTTISGKYAHGNLRSEKGVHRLVRISPFDSSNRRHTSFALVEVYPQVETDDEVEIRSSDLKIDTYRSAGAGGQNVQKNETAIRITHLPTGIVVTCQNERSQTQNKDNALKVLRARLLDLKREQLQDELAQIKGEHIKAEWGSQIRSYILHPYQMVKDHRTKFEVGNTTAVLDGGVDPFIEAYLRFSVGSSP